MKLARLTFALVLVTLMAGLVLAQEQKRGPRGPGGFSPMERLAGAVSRLDGISDDQKAKLEAVKTEYAPKFKALRDKGEGILTAEQKAARDAAIKTAREGKPEDMRAAFAKVRDAVKLTDDQKKQMEENRKAITDLVQEARTKVEAFLTDPQKAKLKEVMSRRPGGKRRQDGGQPRTT